MGTYLRHIVDPHIIPSNNSEREDKVVLSTPLTNHHKQVSSLSQTIPSMIYDITKTLQEALTTILNELSKTLVTPHAIMTKYVIKTALLFHIWMKTK